MSSSKSQGFTLIEVLLAMAILAVTLTVIYSSFSTAGRSVEQAEELRDEADLARALMNRLSLDIANVYAKSGDLFFYSKKEELTGEQKVNDFTIRHDSIAMTTLTNWPKPNSKETELWEVGYFFKEKPEGNGYSLYRREKRDLKESPALEGGIEFELTDQVQSLQFRYSRDGKNWTDEGWPKSPMAPKVVEIIVILNSGKVYTTKVDVGNS